MTLSVKTRFDVFKRDRFTCQYCGKHPPDVLLEADHIVPRAAGGGDDIVNLTTACSDCNRGKGGRLLEEGTGPAINRSAIAEMQERIEQAKAYMEVLGGSRLIFVELKRDGGKPTADQLHVLDVLGKAAEAYVWTPKDWDFLSEELR